MNNGNVGPGNNLAQNFERSMTEAPQFNPEFLPEPEDKEKDPGDNLESVGNNPNANNGLTYIDPMMLGASTINAAGLDEKVRVAALGEVVDEAPAGMKKLTEDQIIGTDINTSKFAKDGVSNELAKKLDANKKEPNLYRQMLNFVEQSKKSLAESFVDRKYLDGGKK